MMDIGGAETVDAQPVGSRGRGGGRGGGGPPGWPTCEFCNNKFSAGSIQVTHGLPLARSTVCTAYSHRTPAPLVHVHRFTCKSAAIDPTLQRRPS